VIIVIGGMRIGGIISGMGGSKYQVRTNESVVRIVRHQDIEVDATTIPSIECKFKVDTKVKIMKGIGFNSVAQIKKLFATRCIVDIDGKLVRKNLDDLQAVIG